MSIIGEMFEKDIDRPMNPVIKVSDQTDEKVIFQELDEYVVTKEIDENLEKFYKGLIDGISRDTDNIGAWISGDFGSGKSHFLKILSFLLKNSIISGKKSTEYLQKKVSPPVYAYMQAMGKKNVETVLFDIDAESKEGQNADNLVQIYLMVFNRMLGLSTVPSVADLERHIIDEGKYDLFKSKYQEISDRSWEDERTKPAFVRGRIEKALVAAGVYGEDDAKDISKKASEKYEISASDFTKLVKEHCDKMGENYVLLFLVDEVGQFISGNTQLMLKLQTITQELGTACRGHAWNVVTSQEDVDSIAPDINNKDYSKIQGRFSIRVKMSSSDVKEVIEKRILSKKGNYVDELQAYYDGNRDAIHNKLNFDNGMNIRLYKDKKEYSATYPFVPYQYQMLQTMLTQLRNKSRAGKNISNAARSMLKTFRDTVVAYKDKDSKTVIPMYAFYDSLTPELDSPTLQVFYNATKNDALNEFDINVLKTLFLVKYYDGLTTSVANITSMMVSSFDEDRITIKKGVEDSLERLTTQNLVQRNGDTYMFLTNEEQEVNIEIKRETVDIGKRIQEISRVAFGEILDLSGKYRYDGTHQYSFNRIVDGENAESTSYELNLSISTPARKVDGATLAMESNGSVVLELPADDRVIMQCNEYISTENYLRKNMSSDLPTQKKIILEAKEMELKAMKARFKDMLTDALQNAKIYVNGSQSTDINETNPKSRVDKAMGKLITATYSKMDYMRNPKNKTLIEQIFKNRTLSPFDECCGSEKLAVNEVIDFLSIQARSNATVRISNIMEKYKKKPYGFTDYDIEWILALLFRHNKIALIYEGVTYDGKKVDSSRGIDLVTKTRDFDRVEIKLRESVSSASINRAADIFKTILAKSMQLDEGALVTAINDGSREIMSDIDGYLGQIKSQPKYPWKSELEQMRQLLNDTASAGSPDLFLFIDSNEDALRKLRPDLDDKRSFFAADSPRRRLFDRGLDSIAAYEKDAYYVSDEMMRIKGLIDSALNSDNLVDLPKLNTLCAEFNDALEDILNKSRSGEIEKLNGIKSWHESKLSDHSELFDELSKYYEQAKNDISNATSLSDLYAVSTGFKMKAADLEGRIPKKDTPATPRGPAEPKAAPRSTISMYSLLPKIEVNDEKDVDEILNTMRDRLNEKLKAGPFDIKL